MTKVMETVRIPEVNRIEARDAEPETLKHTGHRIIIDEYDHVPNDRGLFLCVRQKDSDKEVWLQADVEQLRALRDAAQRLLDIQEEHAKPEPMGYPIS